MTRPTGTHTLAAVLRLPVALLAAALLTLAFAVPASASTVSRTVEERIEVPAGPGQDGADRPRHHPVPARHHARTRRAGRPRVRRHKASVDADARELADRGFVVLAWSARGFGASGGQIALNSPDHEVADARALVDRLAARPEVVQDGPGDPRVGVTGGSYGGALALLLAGYDPRVDALAPVITWNDLGQALFPNAAAAPGTLPADTPARGAFAPDGVFKRGWAGVFFSAGPRRRAAVRGGAADGTRSEPSATSAGGHDARPTGPACPTDLRPLRPRRLRRLHRGRHHRTALPRHRRAAAPLLPRLGHGPDHRADAARPGRAGHPVRARPGRRQRPPDRRGRRHRPGALVRAAATTAARRTSGCATRSATGSTTGSPGDGDDPGTGFGYTVASGVRTGGDTPTSRTVEAPAYPGLARDSGGVHAAARRWTAARRSR